MKARALLPEENWGTQVEPDENRNDQNDGAEQNQDKEGHDNVCKSLDPSHIPSLPQMPFLSQKFTAFWQEYYSGGDRFAKSDLWFVHRTEPSK